jgi:heat shock protein HspQ
MSSVYGLSNVLGRIERAAVARQRYVLASAGHVDQAVDHQLCAYIGLLADIAKGQSCTEEQVEAALTRGAVTAAAEVNLRF